MKFTIATILSVVYTFSLFAKRTNGAKILVLVAIPSYSHQVSFRPLCLELHKRGHEVTFVTPNPIPNINATNFRQIDVGNLYQIFRQHSNVQSRLKKISWLESLEKYLLGFSKLVAECAFNNTELRKLYAPDSKDTFDLVLIEMVYVPSMFAFAHRFNAPVIGLSSLTLHSSENYALGGLVLPSHDSTWEMEAEVGTNLSFWKRLINFWKEWHYIYFVYNELYPLHQELAEKYLGKPMPPILDLVKNTSLVFVNEDPVMNYARPQPPNIINFYSLHVSQNSEPLSEELKKFVDGAKDGFIYFSLGTNARFTDLPEEMQRIFYDVFANLPYKIVWKNEKQLPNLPDNVYMRSWFPQQSILAHPNIKLYMYQGGLQSSQEAIHYSVPVLGFPVHSDQEFQLKKLRSHGVGNRLTFEDLTRENLKSTIEEMITNKEYKKNMIKLRRLINDKPYDSIENLVWWTEYVIRHKGAPHLRTNLAWVPWYQYCDMDIVAFLAVVLFTFCSITLWVNAKIFVFLCDHWQTNHVSLKSKTS